MNLIKLFRQLGWFLTSYNTLNNLSDAVLMVNDDGVIESYNKRAKEIFGFVDGSFGNYQITEIIKDYKSIVTKSAGLAQPILAIACRPENEFYIELTATKRLNGHCIVVRDITALTKEIKNDEKIMKFNNEKNAMLVKLADDIKAPVNSIAGFSGGLLDGLGGDLTEKQSKYVRIIHHNAIDLTEFMDKLLMFSRVESSIYEENYRTFDVVELIKNQSKDFIQMLEDKGIGFSIESDKIQNRNIYSDINAMQDAYKNILEVAVNMTEKGYISVNVGNPSEETCQEFSIGSPEKYLHLIIRDTGVGIAAEDLKYLCEPYAQLEKGKKNLLRAFRLGIASILVKRVGGYITVKSEVMKGTRYDIIVPIEKR